jgi:transketolase
MYDIKQLETLAAQVRRDIVRMVYYVNSGHPGGSLGAADFMTALYFRIMDIRPEFNMSGENEDIFVLSNGHLSPLLYSVLARKGYFPLEELSTFRKINSRLQGHPTTHEGLPGIRISTGSLGQGLGAATGMALGKKMSGDPNHVFVLTGDGELQEGSIWEALMFAPVHQLDNLIVTVDWNGQQIDGPTDKILCLGDLEAKFTSFGWCVVQTDGNDMTEIVRTLEEVKRKKEVGVPTAILMRTVMGQGVSYMEGHHEWHGKAPNKAQFEQAMSELPETLGDYPYNENYNVEIKKH